MFCINSITFWWTKSRISYVSPGRLLIRAEENVSRYYGEYRGLDIASAATMADMKSLPPFSLRWFNVENGMI